MPILCESIVEEAALDWFRALGYYVESGPDMSPGPDSLRYPLRASHADVVLTSAVRGALRRLNPELPDDALNDALRKLTRLEGATLEARNRAFHRMLVDGVAVEYRAAEGAIRGGQARVIDFDESDANTWSAINQFTVTENGNARRPDIVVFVNGLPLAVIELKNPADENATVWSAFQQLQTYKAELPSLFACNAVLAVSDGMQARLGTLSAGREWFKPWRTIDGQELAPAFYTELQVAIEGVFEKRRFLSLLRDFIVFEDDGGALVKKMAGYHQFHAVQAAVGETLRAAALQQEAQRVAETGGRYEAGRQPGGDPGDRRIGVVWHTQGSGKSLTMAFYAGRIIREQAMANPTVVVLTDRNDLDDQLFGTFARCQDLLRQPPVQAASRADLRAKLAVEGRRRVHHHPEVLPGGEGRPPPVALRPAQHRRHRRRGASQPIRLPRRLCAPHARCAAQRLVHRLHRHADRASGRQHPRRVRGLHQRLRHPARGRGQGDGADLLREPARQADARRARAAEDRRGLRGSDRGRGGRPQGEAQDQVGAARSDRRGREAPEARRPGHRRVTSTNASKPWTARR